VGLSCGEGPNARGTGGIPKAGSAAVSFAASGSATTWGETTGSTGAVRIVVGRYLPEGDSGTDSRGLRKMARALRTSTPRAAPAMATTEMMSNIEDKSLSETPAVSVTRVTRSEIANEEDIGSN
jgi:hypothetical protein